MTNYPRNQWYVAGFDEELQRGALLPRTYLGERVVLFREPDGTPRALEDRCPHRFAPLSAGTLREGGIQCGYHGLTFDGSGTCVRNPHGAIPKAACVKSYPVRERHRLLWIWMGEPALADEVLIPDFSAVAAAPEHSSFRGYLPTACDTLLLVDNILDLSHVDFLHPTTLGSGAISRVKATVEDLSERSVRVSWISSGDIAPRAFDTHLRQQGQPTDQWTEVTWTAPSNMLLCVGATLQGEPRSEGVTTLNLHLGTPEGPGHTHYWYWATRDFAISPEANAAIRPMVEHIFRHEDKPMLEAQQRRIGEHDFWSLKPVLLAPDAGAVRARRKLTALAQAEAAA
ncbi:aromatic ring-hydroxylating dioxygenase subunit alpha (plasmid) [Variovorax sp. V59]|uniref:aromatic ring-hydroxylating dioxygenase subunit alpha n=1 Tax=unclassified Variovorax TaxID=663243 RepID=UPI0034E861DB